MKRPIVSLISSITLGLAAALVPVTAHAAAPPATEYAALGDSYAAGYGIAPRFELPGTTAELCARSSMAYPVRLDRNQADSPSFDFAACSGALTTDIIGPQPLDTTGDTAVPQDTGLSAGTDVVTLTIGGNDIGFGDAAGCLKTPTAPGCGNIGARVWLGLQALASTTPTNFIDPVTGRPVTVAGLPTALGDILAHAPNAQVYVSDYPVLLASCGQAYDSLNQANVALNSVIQQVTMQMSAAYPRVHFVDAAAAFAGHDVCSAEPWISSTTLHPTIAGQVGYANAFREAMRATSGS
ncbi:MAG TPA: SGNH/GDSL hydrolase family protein [Propionibacteriaceae bacterium]|nr:SGNH/GDSL hydrolase family protein [Propionibacteriaceae bacterium]